MINNKISLQSIIFKAKWNCNGNFIPFPAVSTCKANPAKCAFQDFIFFIDINYFIIIKTAWRSLKELNVDFFFLLYKKRPSNAHIYGKLMPASGYVISITERKTGWFSWSWNMRWWKTTVWRGMEMSKNLLSLNCGLRLPINRCINT